MTTLDTLPGLKAIDAPGWRNELGAARPHRETLPARLIGICDQDSLVVPATSEAPAPRAGERTTVKHYPIGHFDIYLGEWFERSVTDQVAFLQEALKPRQPSLTGGAP